MDKKLNIFILFLASELKLAWHFVIFYEQICYYLFILLWNVNCQIEKWCHLLIESKAMKLETANLGLT